MLIDLNGVQHHYVSKGEGPPVVFVHGLGGSLHFWHGVMENLTAHHHCIAPDLRGHGRSDVTKGTLSVETWAQDVEALMSALELPPATVVGHSIGSVVAQHLAVAKPELVDSLVLVGGISWYEPPARKAFEERADRVEQDGLDAIVDDWLAGALAPRTHGKLPQLAGLLRDLFLRNDPKSYAKACRAVANMPKVPREQIGQPTLLVVGNHDRSTPIAMTEELHSEIPVSRVRVLPASAHWLALEQPDALAAAILEFLT
jgi:3-oxoadipate enol-lactonase